MIRALMVVIVVGACGGGGSKPAQEPVENKPSSTVANPPPPPPQTESERVFAKFTEFEKAMCACTNTECARRVSDDMTKWAQAQAASEKEPPKMTEDEQKRATEIGTRMAECMQKAMETE